MKRIAIVIAFEGFRDEELLVPYQLLTEHDFEITVYSSQIGLARGKLGARFQVDADLNTLDTGTIEALVFIGGPGGYGYIGHPKIDELAQSAYAQNKLVAAICMAPLLLGHAGLLEGRKSTVFAGDKERLIEYGAIYTGAAVEMDGQIITADGPTSAQAFAQAIEDYLNRV